MPGWITHNLKSRTKTNKLPFVTEMHLSKFSPGSFAEESRNVCLDLFNKYDDKLYLSFSGGSDSLYIANLFEELQLPIKLVIVSCPYNQLDIKPAFKYCSDKGIEPIVLKYGPEYLKLVEEKIYSRGLMSAVGLTTLLVYDYIRDIGGKVISGQGEPQPILNHVGSTLLNKTIQMYEFEFYLDVYADVEQPAPFYCYNQNIFYSYLKEINKTKDIQQAKCELYRLNYKPKTFWSEEIYTNIRNNIQRNNLSNVSFFQQYDWKILLSELENYIV